MEYVHLGRTGLLVSPLCLGTMNFGWEAMGTDEEDAFAIMDRALEHGINFFDTANVYGWREGGRSGEGITEQIIGRWFAQGGGRRDRVVLATKVFSQTGDVAERVAAVGAQHPPSMRREPAAAPDGPHRPLPVPPRRPRQPVGRDLAGDGDARPGRQDRVRRQQQLRRLAHRRGERGRPGPALPRAGVRAVQVQPARPDRRARGAPGVRALRPRASSPTARSPAGSSAARCRRRARAAGPARRRRRRSRSGGRSSRRTRSCAPSSAQAPADVALAWLLATRS